MPHHHRDTGEHQTLPLMGYIAATAASIGAPMWEFLFSDAARLKAILNINYFLSHCGGISAAIITPS
ncbi:hypothetical protein [Mesorhizobium sp. IMUNJ 23232]|uniref:hypothetical protein n=1 Tax=Mesorhizobium sp. IMUNJ 23232 TaxID=3376064 RepID=UPI0037BBC39E